MKTSPLILILFVAFTATAKSQDGNGRLFETLLRGLAHVVASENGSPLVPPPIPYDPHAGHAHTQKPAPDYQNQGSPSRNWFQPTQPQPQPRVVNPTPQPRVIRQPQVQPRHPSSPFSGWYQAPQAQPQPPVQYHQPSPQVRPAPAPPFSGFNPFQNQVPDYHEHHDHGAHQGPQPGFFGQRQQPQPQPQTSRHSRDESHGHHDRHDHGSHPQSEPSRVIAIRSQFQPFTIFQGQQNQRVISGRTVQPVPNQGSIIWLRTR